MTGSGIDGAKCLSGITQKKRKTPEDEALLRQTGAVWGCDVCQLACPMNRGAAYTEIPFFKNSFADIASAEAIEAMRDEEFALYCLFMARARRHHRQHPAGAKAILTG